LYAVPSAALTRRQGSVGCEHEQEQVPHAIPGVVGEGIAQLARQVNGGCRAGYLLAGHGLFGSLVKGEVRIVMAQVKPGLWLLA